MYTEVLMMAYMIDSMEGLDVATYCIPGAFLQTDYKKSDINIKMEGVMVTLLEDIYLAYYKCFVYLDSRGRKYTYEEDKKTIYGTL